MPKTLIETFSVEWLQILDEDGNCDEELHPSLDNEQVKKLYEWMVLARTFDEKAFKAVADLKARHRKYSIKKAVSRKISGWQFEGKFGAVS